MIAGLKRSIVQVVYILAFVSCATAYSAMQGCASVSLSRTETDLTLEYSSFMKKLEAPAVQVNKTGDYSASFNAESSSTDPMAAMMMQMFERSMCIANPAMCAATP